MFTQFSEIKLKKKRRMNSVSLPPGFLAKNTPKRFFCAAGEIIACAIIDPAGFLSAYIAGLARHWQNCHPAAMFFA